MIDNLPYRKNIRLKEYDYSSAGVYFVTICTKDRKNLFGKIKDGEIVLNIYGKEIEKQMFNIHERYKNAYLDQFVVMPNHIHLIISVGVPLVGTRNSGQVQDLPLRYKIGDIIGAFKSITTNEIIKKIKLQTSEYKPIKLWQRNYYEHIIRNEAELNKIREYIINNPLKWEYDEYYNSNEN